MMRDMDELIDEALDAEERELLRALDEPGFFSQAFSVFRGPAGWMSIVMMIWQAAMFIAGVWAAWHFFEATDPVTQLRWGLPAAILLIFAAMFKMALMPRMESNRLLRELKRLELQLAYRSKA
ncbi:DUF6768 family protein [Sphingomonas koreensis]|jgi:hypothetical protein|uniref:Uncharacterized protein n=2 Tax=Sphingomonas koreensis TaxID=93064 RepID=A0A1L6J5M5_9SPHN|nr:DUF6768 family protein [Sphingomonas koreensis]APR51261.1 hypothetical protein BRX40_01400 [Sphingomonas koreensis]MDC7810409.1 hypothetical protein [Sphingomonas koreensis]